MKFAYNNNNNNNNNKYETNYDELENSIVDSLSEISIASNLPINIQNQNLINNAISDVVSLYLWSSDFSHRKSINENDLFFKKQKKHKPNIENAWETDSKSFSKQISSTSFDEGKEEFSPTPINTRKVQSSSSLLSHLTKDDNKASKFVIPSLDLSYLKENKINKISDSNVSPLQQQHKHEENLKKEKINQSKQIKNTNDTVPVSPQESKLIINEFKQKNSELIKKKTDSENNPIKFEIESLLRDLKLVKYQNTENNDYYDQENENKISKAESEKLNLMAINLKELLTRLLEKRKQSKRVVLLEKMSKEEIHSEKIDTQKELLAFEEKYGRPQTKLEKDLMRPLYDHYRKVKRILAKSTGKNNSQNLTDLPDNEIEEDETVNTKDHKHFLNLHSLSLIELLKEKEIASAEKTKLKDVIKKYEIDFTKSTGRPLAKEDREFHKEDFERYKILKAKLKLIEALIEKHETTKK